MNQQTSSEFGRMKTLKTVNANPDQPLSGAEQNAWDQFRASDRNGQALFHPWVHPQDAKPHCVVFLQGIGRLVVQFMPGLYRLRDDQWLSQEATGANFPLPDPLQEIWRSANAVRNVLKPGPDVGIYAIPVLVFPDMGPDAGILAEAQRRKVRVLFGASDLVSDLVDLPSEAEMRPDFNSRYIEEEVQLLMRRPDEETDESETPKEAPSNEPTPNEPTSNDAPSDDAPSNEEASPAVEGPAGAIVVQRVEVMNIYITVVNGGNCDEPPVITVQGQ